MSIVSRVLRILILISFGAIGCLNSLSDNGQQVHLGGHSWRSFPLTPLNGASWTKTDALKVGDPWPHPPPHRSPYLPAPPHRHDPPSTAPHDNPIPVPADPLPPKTRLPEPDYGPHRYNKLLNATTRVQFFPPIAFLFLYSLVSIFLTISSAYQQRHIRLINTHPQAHTYRPRLVESYGSEYGNMASSAEPLDLSNRSDAEQIVHSYVQEVQGTKSVVRNSSKPGPENEPLLSRAPRPSGHRSHTPVIEVVDPNNRHNIESDDPDFLGSNEHDAEWGPWYPYKYQQLLSQPDFLTAIKNSGQVLAMLFMITFALALISTQMVTSLPQPSLHEDVVGSRMRTLMAVLSQFLLLGVGLMWAFGEASYLAVRDLQRTRVFALSMAIVMMIVYGVNVEAENRARLREINRILYP